MTRKKTSFNVGFDTALCRKDQAVCLSTHTPFRGMLVLTDVQGRSMQHLGPQKQCQFDTSTVSSTTNFMHFANWCFTSDVLLFGCFIRQVSEIPGTQKGDFFILPRTSHGPQPCDAFGATHVFLVLTRHINI